MGIARSKMASAGCGMCTLHAISSLALSFSTTKQVRFAFGPALLWPLVRSDAFELQRVRSHPLFSLQKCPLCAPNAGSRRLLLNKREIRKLDAAVQQKGLTIVPVKAYFNCDNRLKLQIALARGKNVADKRDTIKQRDTDREVKRQMKDY